ncbi:ABC transporter ATP-binding protein/permease [Pseudomonas sp. GX19020]|uniref:ABC transporter ATP-binding protein n=1 Tax=Pseudomonas sp. GX19020 TaxID=2942277 RepID=UPI002019AB1F|nr:ABC transporter ATP-binding protein [Pseudomonas sp. GX19020]MCL4065475.1 ABC transporter ATP-binding protein/permease [Pseudomonas sp. GX19020]
MTPVPEQIAPGQLGPDPAQRIEVPMPAVVPPEQRDQLFRRFWRDFLKRRAGLMLLALLVSALEGSTLGLLSATLEPLFDDVFASRSETALIWVGLGILALFLFRALTSILGRWLLALVNFTNATEMQVALVRHLLTLDGNFYQKNPPGSLIERVQGDTIAAQTTTQLVIAGIGRDLVSLIGLFVVALMIDVQWTLVALIGTPLLLLPAMALQRYVRRKTRQMRVESGLRATRLDEIFHGIQQVKLNRMEDYQTSRFSGIVNRIRRAEIKSTLGRSTMPALVDIVTGIGFFAVLIFGGTQVVEGTRTTGEFMAFFTAMALTFQPIRKLSEIAGQRQIALASLERIYGLFDTEPNTSRPAVSRALPATLPPEIRLENVSFGYEETPVLNGLSFTARAGRVTALVGASGAGKSTIFHLLTALADPQQGRILIGGADASGMSLTDQRRLIAAVSQEAALFDETLRENLILGRNGITETRLEHVLEDARVSEFLGRLPDGLDSLAGPRGSALSGGQRQRVAIARALLADAPILLLDEATSALDTASERAVTGALARAQAGRTTLVIAHRLATVREADHIVVLDQGRVIEEGTHDALIAAGGQYARLYALQFRD